LNNNSNSHDNENSNEGYSMTGPSMMDVGNKQDLSTQLQLQFQGNPNFGSASFVDPSVMHQTQATRYAGPSSMMGSAGQRIPAFNTGTELFTPLTPNTIEEIVQQNSENSNRSLPVKQEQQNMGLSMHQLSQLGFDQLDQQQQFQQYQMQMQMQQQQQQYNDNKRKQLPSFDELGQQDEDSPQTKKRKVNNLTIQLPPNRPQIPMRRVDGMEESQEIAQFQVPKSRLQQSPPPQLLVVPPSMNSSGSSTDTTQNLTPLGASASFSPYTTDKSPTTNSPVNLSTPTTLNHMDWVKSKQQEEITNTTT
jgi:hypothetical protein